jgi:hypothetical protein
MPRKWVCSCLLVISVLLVPDLGLATRPTRYRPPNSLYFNLQAVSQNQSGATMKATIKSLVGTQSNLSIYFESAKDLKATPAFVRLPALPEGQVREFQVKVTRIAPAVKFGSWVRIRVVYHRDITALKQRVARDTRSYPNASMRKQLLDELSNPPKQPRIEALRFFLDSRRQGL